MTELEVYKDAPVRFSAGACVAICNHPATTMSVDEIKAMRAQPIDKAAFSACIALYHDRFDKEPKQSLVRYYFSEYGTCMGHSEFLAAFRDLMTEDVFFAAGWSYIFKHVQRQRKNGPDLIALGMAEVYTRGAENV